MDYRNHHNCTPASGHGRAETVGIPQAHAGIGDALRRAYVDPACAIPREFAILLEKLR